MVGWALCLTACYSPGYRDCEITCASGTCPAGYTCSDGYCRAAGATASCSSVLGDAMNDGVIADGLPDGNPSLDSDSDGLNDSVDNCRSKPNPMQENEDGDPFGDVCDPCPPYLMYFDGSAMVDANVDADGDGVGAGCDPRPTSVGERIVLFHGFQNFPIAQQMMQGNAQWISVTPHAVRAVTSSGGDFGVMMFPVTLGPSPNVERVSVAMRNVVVNSGALNMVKGAAVVTQFSPANGRGAGCTLGHDPNSTPAFMLVEVNGSQLSRFDSITNVAIADGDLSIRRAQGSNYECKRMNPPDPLIGTPPVPPIAAPHVAMYVRGTSAVFDWLLVVEGPEI